MWLLMTRFSNIHGFVSCKFVFWLHRRSSAYNTYRGVIIANISQNPKEHSGCILGNQILDDIVFCSSEVPILLPIKLLSI
jgi:hypothetical protein